MPKLYDEHGVRIYIYADDYNPPHVHVYHAGDAAKVRIDDCTVIVGAVDGRKLRRAVRFIEDKRPELLEKWQELNEIR